ncbi:MAG: DUF2142 domain-containing protein [Lachnospiraceae bacterium]|nr:DUF2142 domain-containing protein [Lachnospiraceae bacterium]
MGDIKSYVEHISNRIIWMTGVVVIIAGIMVSSWSKIGLKQYEGYTVYEKTFEELQTDHVDTRYLVEIFDENILNYTINLSQTSYFQGEGRLKIFHSNDLLAEVSGIGGKNLVTFDLENVQLEKGENYLFQVTLQSTEPFSYSIDDEGRLKDRQIYAFEYQNILKVMAAIIFFLIILLVVLSLKIKNTGLFFSIISFIMGAVFCFENPPCSVADEFRHTIRAYSYAMGDVVITNYIDGVPYYNVPKEFFEIRELAQTVDYSHEYNRTVNMTAMSRQWERKWARQETVDVRVPAVSEISPIAYLPQILFMKIALLLNMNPIACVYWGRMGNLLLYSLGIGFCIQKLKKYKSLMTAICLIPLSLRFAASNSTDSVLLTLVMIAFTYLVSFIESDDKEKSIYCVKSFVVFALVSIGIANVKIPYTLLLLSLLALNKSCYKGKRVNKIIFVGGVLFSGIFSYQLMQRLIVIKESSFGLNAAIANFMKDPVSSGNALVDGFYHSYEYVTNAYGIGYLDVIYIIFILICAWSSTKSVNMYRYQKWMMLLVGVFTWCCVIGAAWTWGAGKQIRGMHGRYIFEILPFLLIPFAQGQEVEGEKNMEGYCRLFEILIIGGYAMELMNQYYIL